MGSLRAARATPPPPSASEHPPASVALMRVNHAGEVAAQALYHGQAWGADAELRQFLVEASFEEQDHLHWCLERLKHLGGRPSYLEGLWYWGALGIGSLVGIFGKRYNLGFLAATEQLVAAHLEDHLAQLSEQDTASRAILEALLNDERKHAESATEQGGGALPRPVVSGMRLLAGLFKEVSRSV